MARGDFLKEISAITETLPSHEQYVDQAQGAGESMAAIVSNRQLMDFFTTKFLRNIDQAGWLKVVEHSRGSHVDINLKPEHQGVIRLTHAHGTSNQEVSHYKLMAPDAISKTMDNPSRLDLVNLRLTNEADHGLVQIFVRVSESSLTNIAGAPGNHAAHTFEEEVMHNPDLLSEFNGQNIVNQVRELVGRPTT